MPPRLLAQDRFVTKVGDEDRFGPLDDALLDGEVGHDDVLVGEVRRALFRVIGEVRLLLHRDVEGEVAGRHADQLLTRARLSKSQ